MDGGCKTSAANSPVEATQRPTRIPAKIGAVAAGALTGLGVFLALDARAASRHDVHPTSDEQQSASLLSAGMYVTFGLAIAAAVTTAVLLLAER
jgi:hypothetical protein